MEKYGLLCDLIWKENHISKLNLNIFWVPIGNSLPETEQFTYSVNLHRFCQGPICIINNRKSFLSTREDRSYSKEIVPFCVKVYVSMCKMYIL